MGRLKRRCPTCQMLRFPGKAYAAAEVECYYCIRERTGTKTCSACGEEKPLDQFPGARNKVWRCKPCNLVYNAQWRAANPEKVKAHHRKHGTGVDDETWQAALAVTPACPICLREWSEDLQPHADHDHATGRFRGPLCGPCNRSIGLLGEDVARMARAIAYLTEAVS